MILRAQINLLYDSSPTAHSRKYAFLPCIFHAGLSSNAKIVRRA